MQQAQANIAERGDAAILPLGTPSEAIPDLASIPRVKRRLRVKRRSDRTALNLPFVEPLKTSVIFSAGKRAMDLSIASLLLLASAPLWLVAYTLIRLTSRGPAIITQERLTVGGRPFKMFKFRTMYENAETCGAVWAEANDPRVTRVGRILRRTRIDELPQLWNVMRGEMSIVGPRPERTELALQICEEIPGFHKRLRVKAGLTGLAQITNGYAATIQGHRKKLALDRLYVSRQSLLMDLLILIRTVPVVVFGSGAR